VYLVGRWCHGKNSTTAALRIAKFFLALLKFQVVKLIAPAYHLDGAETPSVEGFRQERGLIEQVVSGNSAVVVVAGGGV
jgi:hypothetical protein